MTTKYYYDIAGFRLTGSRHFKVISPKKIWAVDRVDFSHFGDSIRVQYLLEDIDFTDLCHHQKRNHYEKTFFPVHFLYIEEINPVWGRELNSMLSTSILLKWQGNPR